jgi:hypothetical protein
MEKEICICAAVVAEDGTIVRGQRHGDCLMAIDRMGKKQRSDADSQGFVTSRNRYVDRRVGRILQMMAGIKSADKDGYRYSDILFSEDLY